MLKKNDVEDADERRKVLFFDLYLYFMLFQKLNKVLAPDDEIPARLSLKYRTQRNDESIPGYAYELQIIADRAFTPDDPSRENVLVDTFCTGLLDIELRVKLIQKEFKTLDDAVAAARKLHCQRSIRKFMTQNQGKSDTKFLYVLDDPEEPVERRSTRVR